MPPMMPMPSGTRYVRGARRGANGQAQREMLL
jgi:hypothetical protein